MQRPHLASLVEDFRRHGSQTAIVSYLGNRRYATTYAQLSRLAGRVAAELIRRGVEPGERVVLWGENSAEWVAAFFGCLLRGIIAVPLDAAGSTDFAQRVIADVAPRLIIGDELLLHALPNHPDKLQLRSFNASLPTEPMFSVEPSVSADTPMQIIFTSGTTSEPKGVVHSHRNVLAGLGPIESEVEKYRRYERPVHPLRFLHSLPLSHVFGQFMGLWVPALIAAEVHFESHLEPANVIERIHRERISVLAAVPRVLELLRTHLLRKDPSLAAELTTAKGLAVWKRWWLFRRVHSAFGFKFWAIVSGGATLPPELEIFWNTLGFALIQGYGLTETAALVTLNHPFRIGQGTIGKPLPGREIRINPDGEILVRGEMLSSSFWHRGKLEHREQLWLATGDLATSDDNGQLRFMGRKGDVIVSPSGMNIHPADLEQALAQVPAIRGSAIVGYPTPGSSEPVAVVLFDGSDEQLKEAIQQANTRLADYQQIRRWVRWPQLDFPRTSTGKLLRRHLSDWVQAEFSSQQQVGEQSQSHYSDPLLSLIKGLSHEESAHITDLSRISEDLRLDSLGRVQLQSVLEQQLGIELPDTAFAQVQTLGDLRQLTGLSQRAVLGDASPSLDGGNAPSPSIADSAMSDHVYPHWPWSAPVQFLRALFLESILRPLIWLLAAPRVVLDTGNIPGQPLLIIANHVTALDGAFVLYSLPRPLRRRVAIAMSGEILLDLRNARKQGNWFLNSLAPTEYWLLTALFNVFPLPASSGFRRSFVHAGEALDQGYSVLVFPEGRRSPHGNLQPFRLGIGLLAQQSRTGILPISLKGLGEMKTANARWIRSGKLAIHIGQVISVNNAADANEVTRKLEEIMRGL